MPRLGQRVLRTGGQGRPQGQRLPGQGVPHGGLPAAPPQTAHVFQAHPPLVPCRPGRGATAVHCTALFLPTRKSADSSTFKRMHCLQQVCAAVTPSKLSRVATAAQNLRALLLEDSTWSASSRIDRRSCPCMLRGCRHPATAIATAISESGCTTGGTRSVAGTRTIPAGWPRRLACCRALPACRARTAPARPEGWCATGTPARCSRRPAGTTTYTI